MRLISILFFLLPMLGLGQIVAWDFTGESQLPTSTAEIINANLTGSGLLTRGPNAVESAGANSFRTTGFQNDGVAVTNLDYFQTTMQAAPGYALSLSTIDGRVAGTATYSNAPGVTMQFAYSLDGTTFNLIGAPIIQVGTGNLAQIDLTGVSALQGVPNGTTVTIRFYASGQTTTGGWGFNSNAAGVNGLAFGGTLTPVGGCNTFNTISASACDSYTSPSGDYTWTTSGTYSDTIPNAALCDSILTINLTINPSYSGINATQTICAGQSYVFGTQTLTTAGAYTEIFQTVAGCDSTVNLTLTVVSSFSSNASATICAGESYVLGTQTLTTSGVFSETFTSVSGCDSIVTLTLTVNPVSTSTITETACDSYTSPSGNYIWEISGTYTDTVPSSNGCDSIITINLTVGSSDLITTTASACDSYTFLGNDYTESGVYTIAFVNAAGCDSIQQLVLTISETPDAPTTNGDQTLCSPDLPDDLTVQAGASGPSLIITGIADCPLPGGLPKVVTFYAINDIADLSLYGFGSANNGGGSNGQEFTFPSVALSAGEEFIVATDATAYGAFFNGAVADAIESSAANVNGDDAIELFFNGVVIDVMGDINVDGSGQPWDYLDGWAYRNSGSQPNNGIFDISEWSFSGIDVFDGQTTNASSPNPFPISTFSAPSSEAIYTWYEDAGLTIEVGTGESFATGQTSGSEDYYVVASVGTCESDATMIEVTINETPIVDFDLTTTSTCINYPSITLTGGSPAGGTYSGDGVTGTTFNPATAGLGSNEITYSYTENGCTAESTASIFVDGCVSIEELTNEMVTVFPNPTKGTITISQSTENVLAIEIVDITGKVVHSASYKNVLNTVDMSGLESGSYFLNIQSESGIQRLTIVKE